MRTGPLNEFELRELQELSDKIWGCNDARTSAQAVNTEFSGDYNRYKDLLIRYFNNEHYKLIHLQHGQYLQTIIFEPNNTETND